MCVWWNVGGWGLGVSRGRAVSRSEVVGVGVRRRVGSDCVSCSVSIVITHTLPSMHSNFGPIRHHVLCNVLNVKGADSGPCGGYTHMINRMLNGCRPRNSSSICNTLIHVNRR